MALLLITVVVLLTWRIRVHYDAVHRELALRPPVADPLRTPIRPACGPGPPSSRSYPSGPAPVEEEESPDEVLHMAVVPIVRLDVASLRALAYAVSPGQPVLAVHLQLRRGRGEALPRRLDGKEQALEKILDLTMLLLSDIFPTGYRGCVSAGVTTGSTVYIAGAGPVGLAAAHAAQLLGAAVVIVGDMNSDRLTQARSFGCETVDLAKDASLADQIEQIVGEPMVDCAVDAVGFEAKGHGHDGHEAPATVLNSVMDVTRDAGKLGIVGRYVTGDPG